MHLLRRAVNREMKEPVKKVAVLNLRRLLVELKEHRPDICIRYRLIGQMWATNFQRIVQVTESGVLLNDEVSNKALTITDLTHIMQFELDKSFQLYQAHFHYDVITTGEW